MFDLIQLINGHFTQKYVISKMTYGTAKIIEADMEKWQLQESIDCAIYALHNFNDEQEVSEFMKKEFDLKYEPSWHVVVGQSFGAYCGHEIRKCAYFSVGCLYFLIFKSPDTEVPYIQGNEEEEDIEEDLDEIPEGEGIGEGGEEEPPIQEEEEGPDPPQ